MQSTTSSQLSAFARFCEEWTGRRFADDAAFHEFSVGDFRRFWALFLSWSQLLVEGSPEPVCTSDCCEDAVFFPDLRLSYVENLLRIDSPAHRDSPAVIAYHPFRPVEHVSRGELRRRTQMLAGHLQSLGVGSGDRVAAVASNNLEMVVGALAAAALGASFSSASPDMGAAAILSRLDQLSPVVLMANLADAGEMEPPLADRIGDIVRELPSVRAVVALDDGPAPAGCSAPLLRLADLLATTAEEEVAFRRLPFNHPLFVLFSSGTTGQPKCIVHGAGGTLLEHAKEHRLHADLGPSDVLFFHTSAAWMMWNWQLSALAAGSAIVLYDGAITGPDTLWNIVAEEGVTVFGTSPPYLQLCQDSGFSPRQELRLERLRSVLSTGSILHDWQYDWFEKHVGALPLQSISGGTDIIGCFVLGHPHRPVQRGWIQTRSLAMDVRAHQDGRAQNASIGELVCANPFPSRPLGFLGDDGARFHEAYFEQNPGLWTHGDLIELDELGQARMHGRSDGVLNVRGLRIGPAEIYRALGDVNEVKEALAVQQWSSDQREERVVLLVDLDDGIKLDARLIALIRTEIARNASPAHVPGLIVQVDQLPTTHSGKRSERAARDAVNRRPVGNEQALRNPEALPAIQEAVSLAERANEPGELGAGEHVAPRTDLEKSLVELWRRLLNVPHVGIDDDFFAFGGHSLLAVRLVYSIQHELGRACTLAVLFRNPTIRALAAELHAGGPDVTTPIVLPLQPAGSATALFCIGGVHLYQELADGLGRDTPVYGIFLPVEQELFGLQPHRRHVTSLSVEHMAADYLRAVREQQPQGPYQFLGFSFGGVLAYEMAQQLVAQGEQVSLMALLDSVLPSAQARNWARSAVRRLKRGGSRALVLLPDGLRRTLQSTTESMDAVRLEKTRYRIYIDAMDRYRPRPYDGPSLLLRCEATLAQDDLIDPSYGWGRYVDRLEIRDVHGDHATVLSRPNVRVLADTLRPRLAAASDAVHTASA